MAKITIRTIPDEIDGSKSISFEKGREVVSSINDEILRKNFQTTLEQARLFFSVAEQDSDYMHVKEVKVMLEISASGEIRLIGSAGVEAKGAIEVTLSANNKR